ncbi:MULTISPECIES: DinB family protein [unclassified Nocardia]|uniref:DinB family protein n=1 Tax=unclassified Nocardia TaxID=2637762 RepID=UPI00278C54CD|nr:MULTISPECIES: DinB family protein [unclassified Nocardia]
MTTHRITNGVERTLLENTLDRNREALIATARGLSDTDARRRLVTSLTTPISLLKHAAAAERIWFQRFWAGLDASECDGYAHRDEGTFTVTADESLADVIAEFQRASQRSREIAAHFDLDDIRDIPQEGTISLRWTLLAMIEEFARHAGHGDILREQIDAVDHGPRNR